MEWRVSDTESGTKLAVYLRSKCDSSISAKQIKRALDGGMCRLNDKVERFGSRLVGRGDKVSFSILERGEDVAIDEDTDVFLYVDKDLIAYNKPCGISSEDPRLLAKVEERGRGAILLHRLDRDTTGVLLFARNREAAEAMLALFKERKIEKTYLAIVDGAPRGSSGKIDNFMGKLHVYEGQTLWGVVDKSKGMRALTFWKVLKRASGGEASLIECKPETGRTHQIRVHLSDLGHPILGDNQYGRSVKCSYPAKRVMLHALSVSFDHPSTKQHLVIKAPLPHDFEKAMNYFFKG